MVFHAKWSTPIKHTNRFANTVITFTQEDGKTGSASTTARCSAK